MPNIHDFQLFTSCLNCPREVILPPLSPVAWHPGRIPNGISLAFEYVRVRRAIDIMPSLKDGLIQMVPSQLSGYVRPQDDNDSRNDRGQASQLIYRTCARESTKKIKTFQSHHHLYLNSTAKETYHNGYTTSFCDVRNPQDEGNITSFILTKDYKTWMPI